MIKFTQAFTQDALKSAFSLFAACVIAVCFASVCSPVGAYADDTDLTAGSALAEDGEAGQPAIDIAAASVEAPSVRKCTNKRIRPAVKVTLKGAVLQQDVDYTVSYSDNKKPGMAKITISGMGAYFGTVTKKFKIVGKYKPIVLVPDVSASSAGTVRGWLSRCGFRTAFTKTAKVNLADYDGLVIPGGDDVHPSFYGEKNRHATGCRKWLDKMQIELIHKFANMNKPVLGICRGNQVINVAFGGSLIQNLPGGYHRGRYATLVKKGSWLYRTFGRKFTTSHYHHQAVKKLGKDLVVTQRDAKRKIVEGIEHKSLPVWGVQFHPEPMGRAGKKIAYKFKRECLKRIH